MIGIHIVGAHLLKWSVAALLAANGADAVTSWGRPELNPVLASNSATFGGRAATVKFGIVGGAMIAEHLILRHHPEMEKAMVITNFIGAGALGGVAVRNWRTGELAK